MSERMSERATEWPNIRCVDFIHFLPKVEGSEDSRQEKKPVKNEPIHDNHNEIEIDYYHDYDYANYGGNDWELFDNVVEVKRPIDSYEGYHPALDDNEVYHLGSDIHDVYDNGMDNDEGPHDNNVGHRAEFQSEHIGSWAQVKEKEDADAMLKNMDGFQSDFRFV